MCRGRRRRQIAGGRGALPAHAPRECVNKLIGARARGLICSGGRSCRSSTSSRCRRRHGPCRPRGGAACPCVRSSSGATGQRQRSAGSAWRLRALAGRVQACMRTWVRVWAGVSRGRASCPRVRARGREGGAAAPWTWFLDLRLFKSSHRSHPPGARLRPCQPGWLGLGFCSNPPPALSAAVVGALGPYSARCRIPLRLRRQPVYLSRQAAALGHNS